MSTIIINKTDLNKRVCELDPYKRKQFQMLCNEAFGSEKYFQIIGEHSVSELRKANGIGIDRFLAVTGEIR